MPRLQAFFWKIHFLLLCNTKFYIWVLNYRLFQFLHLDQKFTITMFDSFDCSINNRKYVAMKLEIYFPGINLFFFSKSRIVFFDETLFHRKFSELRNSKRRNWFHYDRLSWTPNDYVQNYFNLDVNFQKKKHQPHFATRKSTWVCVNQTEHLQSHLIEIGTFCAGGWVSWRTD